MKRLFFGWILASSSAALVAGFGCNAILGNELGRLVPPDAATDGGIEDASTCVPGQKSCDGICVSVQDPSAGCSGACSVCATPPNSTASCTLNAGSFECAGTCAKGFDDCDSDASDGCETHLTTKSNCGGCGNDCAAQLLPFCEPSSEGGTASCSATCDAPLTDCCVSGPCATNGDPSGDCADLQSDPKNCGACHQDCEAMFPHAQASCNAGVCTIDSCDPGYASCASGCCTGATTSARDYDCGRVSGPCP